MTSSLHHNDVTTVKIFEFLQKIQQSKKKSLETFLNLKKTTNKRYKKENFLFNINNSILKKLSITKRDFFSENSLYKRNISS